MTGMNSHSMTWLGHSTLLVTDKNGRKIVVDPWLNGNPACPKEYQTLSSVDLILLTHAHFDHIGDAIPLAKRTGADVVGIFELCSWLGKKGVGHTHPMNKGGSQTVRGVKVTMVHADHSCGISDGDEILYGGEAAGFVVELTDGFRFYHAGDTNVFSDMKLIAALYHPDLVCLPIGDLYTMGPREAALAVSFLGAKKVLPLHHGTFPALTGTPEEFGRLIGKSGCALISTRPGETFSV
jgi:L-ascorbate metabolism protein UlaG (beta-lactamase superfamily)